MGPHSPHPVRRISPNLPRGPRSKCWGMTRGEDRQAGPLAGGWGWTQGPGSDVSRTDTWSSARGAGADSGSRPAGEDRPKRRPPARRDGMQGGEGVPGGAGPSSSELLTVLQGEGRGQRRPGGRPEVKGSGRKRGSARG